MKPTPRFLLTALSVLALPAAAATGWLYDPGTKTLTETGVAEGATPWVLSCSASGTSLTLSGVSSAGSDGFLDLSLPVADAGGTPFSIVATGSDAFKNRTEIKQLRFADSTTKIGTRSFQDCAYLESLELPAGLSSIESRGFYGCVRLRTVAPFLPATVSSVGESAFQNCTRLASPLSVGFGTSGGTPVAATMSGRVFQDCKALPSVAVGPGVVKLADNLFVGDTSLTNVVLHDAITSIGSSFNGCTALETVTPLLPASVVAVSAYAFQHCYALSGDLFIATNGAAATIGGAAFYNARGLTSATMGDGVAKIDGNTFCGCSSLTRVRLSANLRGSRNGALCVLVQRVGRVCRSPGAALLVVFCCRRAVAYGVVGIVVAEAADFAAIERAARADDFGASIVAVGVSRAIKRAEGRAGTRDGHAPPSGIVAIMENGKWKMENWIRG